MIHTAVNNETVLPVYVNREWNEQSFCKL